MTLLAQAAAPKATLTSPGKIATLPLFALPGLPIWGPWWTVCRRPG